MKKETKIERMTRFLNRMAAMGFSYEEAQSLRRIEMTLQRWAEKECGDGSDWAIERDEATNKPYNVYHGEGKPSRYAIADREAGALKRVEKIMARHPEYVAFHQGDCRGCMLYIVAKKDIPALTRQEWLARCPVDKTDEAFKAAQARQIEGYYTRGLAVCVD